MAIYDNFFNEDHFSIRKLARDFAKNSVAPVAMDIDKNEAIPEELVKTMADMGFFGLKIPEEYGGSGMDMRSYISVMEEVAKKSATCTLWISNSNSLCTAPILLAGTEEQKRRYLPGVAAGKDVISFGLTEPGAGSDAASLTTKAVKEGDNYILNGRKCFITFAPVSDYCIVFAKTNPEKGAKGITSFMVDMKAPGVSCGKPEQKMGQRGVPVSDVILEDVRVSKNDIIGEIDLGFINAMKTLDVGRVGVSAMALGVAQEAMDLAVGYVKMRVQFGKPLAKCQALQFMLADMEARLNAARLLTYNAAYLMDTKQDSTMAASMAKYFTTETAKDIVDKALQLFGGYGYSREYEIERLYRDIRVTTIYEGSTQIQQMVIAGKLLR
jgi:alkylation response protein AidB-like acyl-CoA dehydrogenase